MKTHEKEALLTYLEFLLMKQLLEPIVEKIEDTIIIGAAYDTTYSILNEIERTIDNQEIDKIVDESIKK